MKMIFRIVRFYPSAMSVGSIHFLRISLGWEVDDYRSSDVKGYDEACVFGDFVSVSWSGDMAFSVM